VSAEELLYTGPVLAFDVIGSPQTQGSKTAITNPKTGRAMIVESGNRDAKKTWRGDIRDAALEAIKNIGPYQATIWPAFGPVRVQMVFRRPRPKGHFGSGRNSGQVKDSAPRWPTTAPDVLKLARAVEDAMTGYVYEDDAQIVEESLCKVYGPPGVSVTVTQL